MLTDYFEINGIFLWYSILMRRSFPTIFRQLSDKLIKNNSSTSKARTYDLQNYNLLLLHIINCYLLLLSFVSTMFILVITVFTFVNSVLFFVSTVLTVVTTVFSFINTQFTFVNAAFFFVSILLNFVRTVLNFVQCKDLLLLSIKVYSLFLKYFSTVEIVQ
jgi:hypothetical protein